MTELTVGPRSRADQVIVQGLADETLCRWKRYDRKATVADLSGALSEKLVQKASQEVIWLVIELLDRARLRETVLDSSVTAALFARRAVQC